MMIKKVLVPVTGILEHTRALDFAAAIGRTLNAHIEARYIQLDPQWIGVTGYEGKSIGWIEAHLDSLPGDLEAKRKQAYRAFQAWADRDAIDIALAAVGPISKVSASWTECIGVPEDVIGDVGRFSDLIVLAQDEEADDGDSIRKVHAGLFGADCPVLFCPPRTTMANIQTAVLGWNASSQSLRALRAALPLVGLAQRVMLLTIGESESAVSSEELVTYLACYGITPEMVHVAPDRRGAGLRLLQEAKAAGADLLVMGAYTHSRTQEVMFGGATLEALENANIPILMAH
jgi:nucleotide-binding universal stress UspA family protein